MEDSHRAGQSVLPDDDWIDDTVCVLADGDIVKAEWIWINVRLADAEPYWRRQWERRSAERAILGFCGVRLPWLTPAAETERPVYLLDQDVGEACGRDAAQIQRCTSDFGPQELPMLCRTCPGPGK